MIRSSDPSASPFDPISALARALNDELDAGTLRIDVTETHPLERPPEVYEHGTDGAFRGKVVVTTGSRSHA